MTLTAILQNAGMCANAIGKASDKVRADPRRVCLLYTSDAADE